MGGGDTEARTYAGWQQEKVAFMFGLTAGRAALLGGAVLAAIIPIATARIAAAVICWPAAAAAAALALVRVQGRTGDEWLAGVTSYALIRARGQHRYAGGPFAPPESVVAGGDGGDGAVPLDLPGILAPLRLLPVHAGAGDLAVVVHPHDRHYTAVARVRFPGLGLSDSGRQDGRVAGWGAFLAGLCTEGGAVARVGVHLRIVPETGVPLRAWHEAHLVGQPPQLAASVAGQLLTSARATSRREAFLTITLSARQAAREVRAAGGGDIGAATVLVRQLRALRQPLTAAELDVEEWLGSRDLAEVIRVAYDPQSAVDLAARRAAAVPGQTLEPGVSPGQAGPVHAEAAPGHYLHDGAASAAYWVHEWPRSQSFATALGPLLADGSHHKSFGMIFEPLSPRTAERAVMRERTARNVAVRMRQRTGQLIPEDERAAMDLALRQDAERAAGHGLVRFTAYAAVTTDSADALEDACAGLEAGAAAARIELRRLWFAQDCGFALACLPLGMGLPRRRW